MRKLLISILVLFVVLLIGPGLPMGADDPRGSYAGVGPTVFHEDAKLTASDAAANDWFGRPVAISGDTVVVGSFHDDHPVGTDAGSAYVFVRSGTNWSEHQKLRASDAADGDIFGRSVAVSGDTVVVGANSDDHAGGTDAGSAYVFVRSGTGWSEQAKLTASDAADGDGFGRSVAVSGDTIVVGATGDDHAGSAYVFVRSGTGWSEQAKLTASDAADGDGFGNSVAVSGETAVVGAQLDDHAGGTNAGSAYVFVRSGTGWSEQAKLTASDAYAHDWFGGSVAISGDTAVLGAHFDNWFNSTSVGSAYVFVRSGTNWSEQAKLRASDRADGDLFGNSVAVSGHTVMVGSPLDNHGGGINAGSAYVFVRSGTGWSEQAKLTASDAELADWLGFSVALSGDTAVVGAFLEDSLGSDAGSAYVFDLITVVAIDIKPKRYPNYVNPESQWLMPVAVMGSEDFDVWEIDRTTLRFGPNETEPASHAGPPRDINHDGYDDKISFYRLSETGIACGDTEAVLTGGLNDGTPFRGVDGIVTVGCGRSLWESPRIQTDDQGASESVFGDN